MAQLAYRATTQERVVSNDLSSSGFQNWIIEGGVALQISVPPQSCIWEVELFVPIVQSLTDNSILFLQLWDATQSAPLGPPTQLGLVATQSFPNSARQLKQTRGPLVYTRRFPGFSGATRTIMVRHSRTGGNWKLLLADAAPNCAYLRADAV